LSIDGTGFVINDSGMSIINPLTTESKENEGKECEYKDMDATLKESRSCAALSVDAIEFRDVGDSGSTSPKRSSFHRLDSDM